MVDGIDGLGEAVTGGLIAREIEPTGAERSDHGHRPSQCLNCATPLAGEYCHTCGQPAHVHRTLGAFWHDVAHSVLHFDGKIWRTLPLLAWRPGELTRRFVAGERARFVSPMALFLFSVFTMFAVVSIIGGPFNPSSQTPAEERAEMTRDFQQERAKSLAEIKRLEKELRQAKAAGRSTAGLEQQLRSERTQFQVAERIFRAAVALTEEEEPSGAKPLEEDKGEAKINIARTGWTPLDAMIEKAEKNPSLLFYKVQNNAYKFSWALIPLSVPFVWLLFLHRRRYRQYKAYDHVVFVTYSICFMSLGFIALSLLRPLGLSQTLIGLAITLIPPVHMYRQLRGAYELTRYSALWRTFVLVIFAFVAASLFFMLLLALGVLG
jgi:hypothetical protein